MDVHAPHEPINTWRDFALHLIIVTIGLLIALSLEALVEPARATEVRLAKSLTRPGGRAPGRPTPSAS